MGKKKPPTMEDAIKVFNEVMQRASLSSYYRVNGVLLSVNPDGHKILVIPDSDLWIELINRDDIGTEKAIEGDITLQMKELDVSNKDESDLLQWFQYGNDLESELWNHIDVTEELFNGKIFKIRVADYEYKIPINRDLMPVKLKKAEYEHVDYRIFGGQHKTINKELNIVVSKPLVLAIKKKFEGPKDLEGNYGFSMIRLFQVI